MFFQEIIAQGFESGAIFAGEDQLAGREAVLQRIAGGDRFSRQSVRTGRVKRVEPIGGAACFRNGAGGARFGGRGSLESLRNEANFENLGFEAFDFGLFGFALGSAAFCTGLTDDISRFPFRMGVLVRWTIAFGSGQTSTAETGLGV